MGKGWHLCRFEGGCATSVGPADDFCAEHAPAADPPPARPARVGGDPRQHLRELDAELFADFAEAALTADKECRKCGSPVPDWAARTNAARLALEHGWGRAPASAGGDAIDPDADPGSWSPAERAAASAAVAAVLRGAGVDLDDIRRVAREAASVTTVRDEIAAL